MTASVGELADAVVAAFAASDLEAAERLCHEDVVVFGTDADEVWWDRDSLLAALDGMRELGLRASWVGERRLDDGWAAGFVRFTLQDGSTLDTRVSLVFVEGLLVLGHYSVPAGS